MFLHIGNSKIVFNRELIGIFNLDMADNVTNRAFLKAAVEDPLSDLSCPDNPKSFVVTDNRILISPISPLTLSRRRNSSR